MPEMTEERRKEYVKIVKAKAEDGRVAVRNIRRKGITDVEAMKADVGEDDVARGEKEIEALTKQHIDAIDDALKKKESELLEV
jgi:ribosome recycling factor